MFPLISRYGPWSRCLDTDFMALGHDNNAWNVVRTLLVPTL